MVNLGIVSEARVGSASDAPLVVRIAALGFYSDPVMSWVFPDPDTRLDQLHTAFAGLLRSHRRLFQVLGLIEGAPAQSQSDDGNTSQNAQGQSDPTRRARGSRVGKFLEFAHKRSILL